MFVSIFKLTLGLHLKLQWKADIRNPFDAFLESSEEKTTSKNEYKTTMEPIQTDSMLAFPCSVAFCFSNFFFTCSRCLVLETGDFIFKTPNSCARPMKMHMHKKENKIVYLRLNSSTLTFDNRRTNGRTLIGSNNYFEHCL